MKLNQTKLLVITGFVILLATLSNTAAASVEVKLVEPEKFNDIELVGFNKKKSINKVAKDLQLFFDALGDKYISDNTKLTIEVTEIDLPGRVEYMVGPNNKNLRILRSDESFRLYFNYRLTDNNGKVIKQGQEKLRDFLNKNASTNMKSRNRNKTFTPYERKLNKWFKQNIAQN